MHLDDLRKAVSGQDFDALYGQFHTETGSSDPEALALWLVQRGLLSREAVDCLAPGGTLRQAAPPRWDGATETATPRPAGPRQAVPVSATPPTMIPDYDDGDGASGGLTLPAELQNLKSLSVSATPPTILPDDGDEALDLSPVPAPPRAARPTPVPAAPVDAPPAARPTPAPAALAAAPPPTPAPQASSGTGPQGSSGTGPQITRTTGGGGRRRKRRDTGRRPVRSGPLKGEHTMVPAAHTYDFTGVVGEGAMGQVLEARDQQLKRVIAFKQMTREVASQGTLASKFQSEVRITAQLDHPNIIPVYALENTEDGDVAYTMKLIHGKTFEDLVKETREQGKRLDREHSLETRLEHFLKVCDAVHFAHDRGIIHRDLKPENLMLGRYNEVYVMDWGISRPMGDQSGIADPVIVDSHPGDEDDLVIGTPEYMSPEQAEGDRNNRLNQASDQYALGLILFELLALKPAVTGKTAIAIVTRQQFGEKNSFTHALGHRIPRELKAIVNKATALDPKKRYPSVHDLGEDIRRYLRNDATVARPDGPISGLLRLISKHRVATLFLIGALFTMASVVILGSWSFYLYRARQQSLHEQNLSHLITTVGTQSALIDGQFVKYQGLLYYVAASATEFLTRAEPRDERVFFSSEYDAGAGPADLNEAERYGRPVSFDFSVHAIPHDLERTPEVERQLQLLAPLHRTFRRALLRSHSEQAAVFTPVRARRLLGSVGTPIAYASVSLKNGVYSTYPGHGGISERFDPTKRPWYRLAKDSMVPVWGTPYADDSGLGLILPCATGLYDDDEQFLGVAAIELTFDYLIEDLLETEHLAEVSASYLLDSEGRVVVDSDKKGGSFSSAISGRTIRLQDFPVAEVRDEVQAMHSGHLETTIDGQPTLVLYHRMQSLGWYYVVMGPTADLFKVARETAED